MAAQHDLVGQRVADVFRYAAGDGETVCAWFEGTCASVSPDGTKAVVRFDDGEEMEFKVSAQSFC